MNSNEEIDIDGGSMTLSDAACHILNTASAERKAHSTRNVAQSWQDGTLGEIGTSKPPDRPARPARPELTPPRNVKRRRISEHPAGRIALLHALAHIELNAIDLAWDIVARFGGQPELPRAFFDDWVAVADDEAKHFLLLSQRLADLEASYGDLPAHDGLWQAAHATADDLLARLAVVPLVLEARGLDVTPAMIVKLNAAKDHDSAAVLQTIHDDEIGHVAVGRRWFDFLCARRQLEPATTYQSLVRRYFRGAVKAPFN
ncbi:MAG: ferritin-like domain-containing protein, partial [Pseudomonadota bacterium]